MLFDDLDSAHDLKTEIIFLIIPSQKEIKILINEQKTMKELIELFLEQTGISRRLFKKEIFKFIINEEKIDLDSNEKVAIFFKEKKNKTIIIEDKEDLLKNIDKDNIKCVFNIGKKQKIKMYINKDKYMSELIKLFMDKMSISNYYEREDLLKFKFNGKIVKHDCNSKIKIIKNGNNIINVIDKNNLIKNVNNKKFTFKTTAGIQNVININQNKNMSDLIKSYFDEIEMPYFYGTNVFRFFCNATQIEFDSKDNISQFILNNNNVILVIDTNYLIERKN